MLNAKPLRPFLNTKPSLSSGLVFDAELFEGSGVSALDLAGNVTGTLTNSPTQATRNPFGRVVTFADSTNIIAYTSISSQNSLANLTLETLVFPTGVNAGGDSRIIHKGNGTKFFDLAVVTGNKFQFEAEVQSIDDQFLTPAITLSQWYHLVVTYTTGTAGTFPTIYLNGVSQSLTHNAPGGGSAVDTTDLGVGNRPAAFGATKGFVGDISYVRLWNRLLSQAEATQLYTNHWTIFNQPNFLRFFGP